MVIRLITSGKTPIGCVKLPLAHLPSPVIDGNPLYIIDQNSECDLLAAQWEAYFLAFLDLEMAGGTIPLIHYGCDSLEQFHAQQKVYFSTWQAKWVLNPNKTFITLELGFGAASCPFCSQFDPCKSARAFDGSSPHYM